MAKAKKKLPEILTDPKAAARAAKLTYTSPEMPGLRRLPARNGFRYVDAKGRPVKDEATIARIRKLAIPPAYQDVWICADAEGHLQAVGRDARGRRQYRYHPRWRVLRDENKYGKMLLFSEKLPVIRQRVNADLSLPGLPKNKVLAVIVRLLETTLERIGNDEYARENNSFGLTTLRNRHVRIGGGKAVFDFRGKSGIARHFDISDKRLAQIVKRCRDMPGQALFQFIDQDGERHGIDSADVNAYLQEITGEEITAKDFRTWAATNLAVVALRELEAFDTQTAAKKNVVRAVEAVAKMLGNTPAICRKCYIHPAIFDGYLDGTLAQNLKMKAEAVLSKPKSADMPGLTAEEAAVTAFLARHLARSASASA